MNKNSFFRVKSLKEVFISSLKLFLLSFPLCFLVTSPLYILHIENFNIFTLVNMWTIAGIRSVFLYLVILLALFLFKGKAKKINVEKL